MHITIMIVFHPEMMCLVKFTMEYFPVPCNFFYIYHGLFWMNIKYDVCFLFLLDVTEPLLVEVDQIYHLACPASPIFYKYNPVKVCIIYA